MLVASAMPGIPTQLASMKSRAMFATRVIPATRVTRSFAPITEVTLISNASGIAAGNCNRASLLNVSYLLRHRRGERAMLKEDSQ